MSTIAFVNGIRGGDTSSAATIATSPVSHTAGNLLVAMFYHDVDSGAITAVSDLAGNTWNAVISPYSVFGSQSNAYLYYTYNCKGNAANVVTATVSGGGSFRAYAVVQFSGAKTAATPFIASSTGTGTGTFVSTDNIFTVASETLIVSLCIAVNAGLGGGSGYSMTPFTITGDGAARFGDQYHITNVGTGGVVIPGNLKYVMKTGSDSTGSGTFNNPWLTINHGAGLCGPGDTLVVRTGSYAEGLQNAVPSGTDWTTPVRIWAYPGDVVWLRPGTTSSFAVLFTAHQHHIEFNGINIEGNTGVQDFGYNFKIGCFADTASNPHHIRYMNAECIIGNDGIPNQGTGSAHLGFLVSANYGGTIGGNEFINLVCHGGGDSGDFATPFYIENNDNVVEHCDCYDYCGWAIQSWNDYNFPPNNNIFRYNKVHDLTRTTSDGRGMGIVTGSSSTNTLIHDNLVYNIGGSSTGAGIYLYSGDGCKCYNNTVYNGNLEGIIVEIFMTTTTVRNNISYANGGNDFRDSAPNADTVKDHNMFLGVNPLFVNVSTHDFHLQSGSPARDNGTTALSATDYEGSPRPVGSTYDIGCYEYGGVPPPAGGSSGNGDEASTATSANGLWAIASASFSAAAAGGGGSTGWGLLVAQERNRLLRG